MKHKKVNNQNHAQYLVLAALTHELTGEEECDIYSYLAKFGVTGFFARIDAFDLPADIKDQLNDLHAYVINSAEVLGDVNA